MRAATLLVLVLLAGVAEAFAQECQTRGLPLETNLVGELDETDCRGFPPICDECPTGPGEYWSFEATAGQGFYFTYRLITAPFVHIYFIDAAGRWISYGLLWPPPLEHIASSSGTVSERTRLHCIASRHRRRPKST